MLCTSVPLAAADDERQRTGRQRWRSGAAARQALAATQSPPATLPSNWTGGRGCAKLRYTSPLVWPPMALQSTSCTQGSNSKPDLRVSRPHCLSERQPLPEERCSAGGLTTLALRVRPALRRRVCTRRLETTRWRLLSVRPLAAAKKDGSDLQPLLKYVTCPLCRLPV